MALGSTYLNFFFFICVIYNLCWSDLSHLNEKTWLKIDIVASHFFFKSGCMETSAYMSDLDEYWKILLDYTYLLTF